MKRLLPLLLFLSLLLPLGPVQANEVLALRHSTSQGRVRLVLDLKEVPTYQVYTLTSPPRLCVEVLDTRPTWRRPGPAPRSAVVSGWKVEQPTLRRFRWVINLEVPLPSDRVRTLVLEDPHRLVVDFQTSWETEETLPLTAGVNWSRREVVGGPRGYLLWNELSFDPKDPRLRLDLGLAHDRLDARETVSSLVRRTGALAGLNAGYFAGSGGPLGLVVRDSKILSPHVARRPPRTVMGLTRDRQILFDRVAVRGGQLTSHSGDAWDDVVVACGGGPRLLTGGRVTLTTHEEELGPKGNDITRVAGRTAVATRPDGRMLMVTGSGFRDNHSQGMKLEELARDLLGRGAREAMNLDGGGSVSLAIRGRKVSDGPGCRIAERPVATALLLFDERPALHPDRMDLEAGETTLPADGQAQTEIVARVQTPSGSPVPDGTPVWFEADGATVVPSGSTVNGEARARVTSLRRPGPVRIRAASGYAVASTGIRFLAGPLGRLVAHLGPQTLVPVAEAADDSGSPTTTGPTTPPSAVPAPEGQEPSAPGVPGPTAPPAPPTKRLQTVDILTEDGWHNALAGIPVRLSLDGREVACQETEGDGSLRLQVEVPMQACELTLSAGDLEPVRLAIEAADL